LGLSTAFMEQSPKNERERRCYDVLTYQALRDSTHCSAPQRKGKLKLT